MCVFFARDFVFSFARDFVFLWVEGFFKVFFCCGVFSFQRFFFFLRVVSFFKCSFFKGRIFSKIFLKVLWSRKNSKRVRISKKKGFLNKGLWVIFFFYTGFLFYEK